MAKWKVLMKKSDFDATARKFGIRNVTARLLTNRGLISDEEINVFLNGDASMLHDPKEMADMVKGADIMIKEIEKGSRIRVIGDYDVDGICSAFILVQGLRLFGADADYVLPDRVKDGYGLSIKLVDAAKADGRDTIITCDNGIAAYDQVAHAKELGMTVVITDHHEVPFEASEGDVESDGEMAKEMPASETAPDKRKEILPPADAVIDPKRAEGNCSFKEICGAVVAYKFLQVMAELLGRNDEEEVKSFFDEMLVFAGIATVCDVMELRDENRIIVKESLRRIAKTKNIGLKALINANSLDAGAINAYHYGFVIGPCLNASGRLEQAGRSISLFLEEDAADAARKADELKNMNDSRKDLTLKGVEQAQELIEQMMEKEGLPKVIVIYLPEIHESLAGIIAGRIKEKYYRPTIMLTKSADGGAKGSGRSIEAYDMFKELSACKDLFTKFGGHKMAAGLSLPEENVDELRRRLNENCRLKDEEFEQVLYIDMEMPFKYADDMDLVKEFDRLQPFGNGNTKPVFAQRGVRLFSGRIMGKNRNCGKYRVSDDSGRFYDMMYFGDIESFNSFLEEKFGKRAVDDLYADNGDGSISLGVAYYPSINSYMGREKVQIVMSDYIFMNPAAKNGQ